MDLLDSAYNRPNSQGEQRSSVERTRAEAAIHGATSRENRYTFEPNEALPVWFLEDEDKYNKSWAQGVLQCWPDPSGS
eukprot:Skav216015  [mRNA]  locus=scaffold833:400247:400752:+ [translate_table: standard]